MKFITLLITTMISINATATNTQDLTLQINYHPKQMTWSINKKDLGKVITQKMIFQGNDKKDFQLKVTPMEYLYTENGTVRTRDMLVSTDKNKRSLVPFIQENSILTIPKNQKIKYNFKVKTKKEMSGCYFFGYYPKLIKSMNPKKGKNSKDNTGIKTAINMQLKMLSGGYLHIKGTEVYKIKDTVKVKKGKSSQEINYSFDFDGNCLLPMAKIKVDIMAGNKIILSKNKVSYKQDDRSLLPGMKSSLKLNTKLKKGKYKIRIMMYSESSDFKNFFHIKEHNFKI